jgi:signal transduction histidine kinase
VRPHLEHALDAADRKVAALRAEVDHADRLVTLGTAAAFIVHEFRNLLTPLRGYAQVALANPGDRELCRRALEHASTCASRASEIADTILEFARPEPRLDTTPTSAYANVRECLDGALRCLVQHPDAPRVRVIVDIPPDLVVAIRPIALEHVLLNLLLNAMTAMRRGGTCRVMARQVPCSTWNTPNFEVEIVVEDEGCGMSDGQIRSALDPFVSGSSSSGLGLAICRRLLEDHGATIDVQSAPGAGTRVTLRLPTSDSNKPTEMQI